MQTEKPSTVINILGRIRVLYALLVFIAAIFVVRAFYLQVIKHDYYQKAALSGQLKQYEIPAERGIIKVHSGSGIVPIVLNEPRYTLFADPKYIKDPKATALVIADTLGTNVSEYEAKLQMVGTRYTVLAKKLTKEQKLKIDRAAKDRNKAGSLWKGIGTRETEYRTYPQGTLAAQLLGFVNDAGEGKYGIEQFMHDELKGKSGELKAITDARGVPLAANKDNLVKEPIAGKDVLLTIDIGMQQQLEDILKAGLDQAKSTSGGALILEANTGAIKAMANYPTYNPAEFFKIEDANLFTNGIVSAPLEVGSIMKPLTAAAAIDLGKINKDTVYFDPAIFRIDNEVVKNVEEDGGPGNRSIRDILQLSLNTGATWMLMQMGGGEVNQQARIAWHDYMVNHFQFGKKTGVEQGYESAGSVPDPLNGYGLNIQYANTAFGQGVNISVLQTAAAYAAVLNGGTYYKPYLVDRTIDSSGRETVKRPEIVKQAVVKPETSKAIQELMEYVVTRNYSGYKITKPRPEFMIGGKTGTAQITKSNGGYYDDRYTGTFVGFLGGDSVQYIVLIRVDNPRIGGYAGAGAAAPIFGKMSDMLINNSYVTPKF
ncbi:penicillin-binding protein 2 [Candidatus Saccharibacteria bacterium]|nr:penicillin-binding protein 2 [Candidatus Saccharibacteria bacterium]MBI3338291.1 penicillin-binding protein 2 [Candidatus Saccharibacteria bacterium]